ncbi:hypothetical protein Csa_007602 [Cucumis sativus]|nr:hypothetical protein Csa_007602 [Cucumis sativus]
MLPMGESPLGGDGGCDRLEQALRECHKRVPEGPARRSACRHLNRSLAECLVATACPSEAEAILEISVERWESCRLGIASGKMD